MYGGLFNFCLGISRLLTLQQKLGAGIDVFVILIEKWGYEFGEWRVMHSLIGSYLPKDFVCIFSF